MGMRIVTAAAVIAWIALLAGCGKSASNAGPDQEQLAYEKAAAELSAQHERDAANDEQHRLQALKAAAAAPTPAPAPLAEAPPPRTPVAPGRPQETPVQDATYQQFYDALSPYGTGCNCRSTGTCGSQPPRCRISIGGPTPWAIGFIRMTAGRGYPTSRSAGSPTITGAGCGRTHWGGHGCRGMNGRLRGYRGGMAMISWAGRRCRRKRDLIRQPGSSNGRTSNTRWGRTIILFVPASAFGEEDMASQAEPLADNTPIYDDSNNETNIYYDAESYAIICYGPSYDFIQSKCRHRLPRRSGCTGVDSLGWARAAAPR